MNHELNQLLVDQLDKLQKMSEHLHFSHARVLPPPDLSCGETLERWEALTSRFARLQDGMIPAFRTLSMLELEERHAERVLDLLNLMEKRGIVASVEAWQAMRQLRNAVAHEYWDDNHALREFLTQVWHDCARLTETVVRLRNYCIKYGYLE
ncbi:MAG: hypothetical protein R8K50_02345 [Mariprofundus sp.]